MFPRSPDFIGIGVQKAGTWWLRTHLAARPDVWMPPVPELHYFDRTLEGATFPPAAAAARFADAAVLGAALDEVRRLARAGDAARAAWRALYEFLDHDDDWYRMLFAAAPPASVVGEITPRYAICGDAEVARMHAVAPRAKLLLMLRDPVERFWAQCKMKHADGSLAPGDPAAMRLFESSNGRPRGEYSRTILRFCRFFDPASLFVIYHDALSREPAVVLREVCAFLGLPQCPVDPERVARRVNAAADPRPMPATLRRRIAAAYTAEMEIMAEVFGGYAASWLEGRAGDYRACVRITPDHVDALRRAHGRPHGVRTKPPCRVFCLSMQRSGTTSVGDWLEAHGLVRAGSPTSVRLGWSRLWLQGEQEKIFASPEFQRTEVFEDDPWWCPGFHQELARRFPDAKFVLLTRDPRQWFESLCHHSGGQNPGWTDLHARIYGREDELRELLRQRPDLDPTAWGLLSIVEHADHYQAVYERHTRAVQACFADAPERLYCGSLDDPRSFEGLCEFVGVRRNPRLAIPRSNARTEEMRRRLEDRLA